MREILIGIGLVALVLFAMVFFGWILHEAAELDAPDDARHDDDDSFSRADPLSHAYRATTRRRSR